MNEIMTLMLENGNIITYTIIASLVLPIIVRIFMIFYYVKVNRPITEFVISLPDNSYVAYEDNEFFVRFLNENDAFYTSHEKLKRLEISLQPISVPIKLQKKFIELKSYYKNLHMVKKNDNFFLTNKILRFESGQTFILSLENVYFDNTQNINKCFKSIDVL